MFLTACQPQQKDEEQQYEKAALTVKGELVFSSSLTLSADSQATVVMTDQQNPADIVAKTTFTVAGPSPKGFQLNMRTSDILKGHHYQLAATITEPGGKVTLVTPEPVAADPYALELISVPLEIRY
ncbi:YbaY family lipoprotein [Gallaecimonas sp. GXIMD1310]|uniref:YbaY family lipoprotein n=1 Tax=Gallaecimonas sp. GXIMD1310 TaxID=3131926 RepID=UPI003249E0CF